LTDAFFLVIPDAHIKQYVVVSFSYVCIIVDSVWCHLNVASEVYILDCHGDYFNMEMMLWWCCHSSLGIQLPSCPLVVAFAWTPCTYISPAAKSAIQFALNCKDY
jgi:hypothetical protein